jgi:hypothetical protein
MNVEESFRVFAKVDKQAVIEDLYESGAPACMAFVLDLILYCGSEEFSEAIIRELKSIEWLELETEEEEEEEEDD